MPCYAPTLSGMTPHRSPKLRSGLHLSQGAAHGSLLCSVCYSALGQTVQKSPAGASLLPGKTRSPAGAASSASCLPRAHSGAAVRWGPTNACGQSHSPL